ncbi:MAG: rod shape-determining protein [Candidatus Kerfeldbacteria bacterium RIFCSPLOWO2_01_FULL_48_11]|uniref:Cell shape-determining protein MreB n=1 Tax=Candidatus Kerfeldbacteria bacterium RIFCSPLOWO2_01_FULL_48_11 TaxID=1798543 RepID=A0A1G2B0Q6_9BACT|nr:MAG: rod shape-determining protein MreB [Parcubacteria group bacterium GW2011_GWA2_48_9]KKW16222.1 MAG: rod shape-determining protein MreB [Parcubacteria group bacterium GW2011_GWC2_49_9]OGY82781.1 MAG: rod shape-determining protein [Candidatus Kerfeldbacteria bacterium RIFCSPLOWO2_01_FULL_48_11]HCJ52669.1 rod shape-determining protein [Candidatus Kerfeldbacteria bacterium]HCM67769.1 rod shape-determining protein [Candidatus Kerfeldbacteria bacterium]
MFNKLFGRFSKDLGVDLGTANTLVYVKGRGIVIDEPSVVAINTRTDQILAVGTDAQKMVGKSPAHIVVSRPLVDGVISDFEITERMLKHFIEKVHRENFTIVPRPRIVVGIPLGVTEVERKAVEDASLSAGAREVYLIEEPLAAAIGARLPVQDASGNMIVDIGGGTTEIAIISLGGVVTWKSLRIAGDKMDQDIINYAREHFNILLGERTAEMTKKRIGSAIELPDPLETKVRGRDLISGLPKEVSVTSNQIRDAISRSLRAIIDGVRSTIENTPPELVSDIYSRGIVLSGGGANLRGLDKLISHETQIPVHIADDPLTAVARGCGIIIEDIEHLKDILAPSTKETEISN